MSYPVTRPSGGFGTSGGGGLVPGYWDSVLGESLYPSLFFYQMGEKRKVPISFGTTIKIPRLKRQTGVVGSINAGSFGLTLTAGSMSGRIGSLCAQVVSGTLQKFAGVYRNSDIALLTALGDPTELAVRDISRDLALQMDTYTRVQLSTAGQGFMLGAAGAVSGQVKAALRVSDVIKAVTKIQASNNARWPDGNYPMILHPFSTYDLKATLSSGYTGAWNDINKFATAEGVEKLYRGEVGRLYGARIIETTNLKRLAAAVGGISAGVTTSGYQGFIFAPEAYYVVEADQMTGRVIVKGLGTGGTYDPDNSVSTVAAKVYFTAFRGFQDTSASPVEYRMGRIPHTPSIAY